MKRTLASIKKDLVNHDATNVSRIIYTLFFDARFRLLLNYRIGYALKQSGIKTLSLLANYYRYKQITKRNCEISYSAKLGAVKFMHPLGIVIGENCIVGDNVEIWQNVTLGTHGKKNMDFHYPTVHDNVKIYAGAIIIGSVHIKNNAVIGANAVVLKDVDEGRTAIGIPANSI